MGRISLDNGEISVLGKEPGTKGHGIPGKFKLFFYNLIYINEIVYIF